MQKNKLNDIPSLMDNEVECIRLLIKKLKDKVEINKIILFGSKARGDYTSESDLDILLLLEGEDLSVLSNIVSDIQFETLLEVNSDLMTTVKTKSEWESGTVWPPLKQNILEEGIEIDLQST